MSDDEHQYTPYDPSADITAAVAFGICLPGSRVLEIGCSIGDDALFLAEVGCQVTAIDTSKVCIGFAKARREWLCLQSRCHFSVGDHRRLLKLAQKDESFDLVSDRLVFSNLGSNKVRREYLESIAHLIRHDGLFLLRLGAIGVATAHLRRSDIELSKEDAAVMDALFRPTRVTIGKRPSAARRRASQSGKWMPMRPLRGGNATAAAVFVLEAKG
jgi:SAM-dependent methyltransferase